MLALTILWNTLPSVSKADVDTNYIAENQALCFPYKNNQHYSLCRSTKKFQGNTYYIPPFHEAMINHSIDELFYIGMRNDNKLLQYFKRKYDECLLHDIKFSKKPKIPKIIHQIWVGPHKLPEHFEKWRESWLKLHPTWEYILWDEEKIAQLKLVNKEFIDQETNYGAKSDLIRYEIIYQFGGLYIDIDFECLKSFDFLHHVCDFYGSFFEVNRWPVPVWSKDDKTSDKTSIDNDMLYTNAPRIVNGIFAASKQHPLLETLIQQVKNFREKKHILTRVGPDYFKNIVISTLPLLEGRNIILPSNYFFSWGNKTLNIMPETLAIHHYTGTWGTAYNKENKRVGQVYGSLHKFEKAEI